MQQYVFQEKYPIYHMEIDKDETDCATVDDVVAYIQDKCESHPKVKFIGVFDHYDHTTAIEGTIAPEIKDAKNVLFCFGFALPNPDVLAVRPRSIGVTDMGDKFVLTFMEAPMPPANEAMEAWVTGLRREDR